MLRNCKLIFLLIQMITYFCRSDGHGFHTGGCRLFLFLRFILLLPHFHLTTRRRVGAGRRGHRVTAGGFH